MLKVEFVFQCVHRDGLWVSGAGSLSVTAPASRSLPVWQDIQTLAYPAWLNTQHTGCFLSSACSTTDLIHTCNYTNAHRPLIRDSMSILCVHTCASAYMCFSNYRQRQIARIIIWPDTDSKCVISILILWIWNVSNIKCLTPGTCWYVKCFLILFGMPLIVHLKPPKESHRFMCQCLCCRRVRYSHAGFRLLGKIGKNSEEMNLAIVCSLSHWYQLHCSLI